MTDDLGGRCLRRNTHSDSSDLEYSKFKNRGWRGMGLLPESLDHWITGSLDHWITVNMLASQKEAASYMLAQIPNNT